MKGEPVTYRTIKHQTRILTETVAEQIGYFTNRTDLMDVATKTWTSYWRVYMKDRVQDAAAPLEEHLTIIESLLERLFKDLRAALGRESQ